MKKLLFGILILFSSNAIAQLNLDWAIKFDGGHGEVKDGLVDSEGNSYVLATYNPLLDINPDSNMDSIVVSSYISQYGTQLSTFLAKYDSLGNFLWGFPFMCSNGSIPNNTVWGEDMEFDTNGNIVLIGRSTCPIDMDPSSELHVLNVNNLGGFIASYDSNGNYLWSRTIVEGPDLMGAYADRIKIDSENNIYLGGEGTGDFDLNPNSITNINTTGSFVSKYNSSGNLIWVKNLSEVSGISNINGFQDMEITTSFEIICASRKNGAGLVIQKLDANGNQTYIHEYGIASSVMGQCDFIPLAYDEMAICFILNGGVDLNMSSGVVATYSSGVSTSQYRGFVMKMNSSGSIDWVIELEQIGGSIEFHGASVDINGDLYFSGIYWGSLNISAGSNNYQFGLQGGVSAYILKISSFGEFGWFTDMSEIPASYSYGGKLWLDNFGSIFQAGQFVSLSDLDPSSNQYLLNSNGSITIEQDVCFIRKLNQCFATYPANTILYNGDCSSPMITITAPNADYYSWSNGDTTQTISVNSIGTYSVYLGNSQGCYTAVNQVTLDSSSFTVQEICDGIDSDCDGVIDNGFDLDADQYTLCNGDCDDTNPLIYPGAPEILDSLDNNCDGQIDEGLSPDADGDGFTVADGDCDDNNASINPNATELCNGVDDNCNTQVDEGFDLDTDTFTSCNGDCDDTNALIYPGAPEVLDSLDNNCDGQIDEGLNPDPDADGDGFSLSEGDCNDADPSVNPAATELCNDIDDNCNSMIDEGFDLDGDGETSCEGDCNDNEALVNTSAIELCNSVDDNCDSFINEGLVCDEVTMQIPNGISPNGDGFNDAWYLPWLNGMSDYSIVISNRWGQVIFQTNDYSTPWDGTYLGNSLPAADYFYVIKLSDNTIYEGVISIKY